MFAEEIAAELPKDLHKDVIQSLLVLLVDNGTLIPVFNNGNFRREPEYRINKRKYKQSPLASFLDDKINDLIDQRIANGEEYEEIMG